jgi:hypothetical protein
MGKIMKLKHKIFKYIKECLGIEKQENSLIEPNRTEVVDLPEDLVINLNNEEGEENGKK